MTGEAIKRLAKERGVSIEKLAEKIGVSQSYLSRILSGHRSMKMEHIDAIARALSVEPVQLIDATQQGVSQLPAKDIYLSPVVGYVQAGAWQSVEYLEDEPLSQMQIEPDHRFPGRPHVIYKVRGDSFDRFVRDGGFVVAIPWPETGYLAPVPGMPLVVQQVTDGNGGLVQQTLKQVEGRPGRYRLIPQSTNPKHNPVPLDGGGEYGEVRIAALVVQFINPAEW